MINREEINNQKKVLIEYLRKKIESSDWHAVADVAMDLRELEAQIEVLNELEDENK